MQLGIGVGTILAGTFILIFVRFAWSYFNLELYLLLLVPVTTFALWLTALLQETTVILYLVLLNFAQKSVIFFVLVLPFYIQNRREIYRAWAIMLMSFEAGIFLSGTTIGFGVAGIEHGMWAAGAVLLLFICCGAIVVLDRRESAEDADPSAAHQEEHESTPKGRFRKACVSLAERYQLTDRELDVLILLARGRTAGFIADDMVISPATAKVHIRNVYTKMQVHSQQDLISMVERQIYADKSPETHDASGTHPAHG